MASTYEMTELVESVAKKQRILSAKSKNTEPHNLCFKNITYTVSQSNKRSSKIILNDVSGIFKSGKLTAVMGPSGAGKSSLLNILAGYRTKGVKGQILINGKDRNVKDKWKISCITQECSLLHNLTTKETLEIAINLKMPASTTQQQKKAVMSDIADILNLQKSMDTKVGKLSGGEKKRLSIGVELVTNPPIMFFDEPTSGLDIVSSIQVISYLKKAALSGRTIICVIHQPSSKIFSMFDDMVLMSEGRIIYGGPVSDMVPAFQAAGFICPQHYNRADYALEVASLEIAADYKSLIEKAKDTSSILNKEIIGGQVTDSRQSDNRNKSSNSIYLNNCTKEVDGKFDYAVSQWRQFLVLLDRSNKCIFRDVYLMYIRIGIHIGMGLWLGMCYYQIGNDAAKILSNTAYLYFLLVFIYFANTMPTILTFPLEAAVFHREILNNWYSLPSYYLSKVVSDIPIQALCPTLLLLISFVMTGQPMEPGRVLIVWVICILFTIVSQATALVSSAAFRFDIGLFFLSCVNVPMFLFSGFFVRFNELPSIMYALSYFSYVGFGFDGVTQAIYGFNRTRLKCSADYCHFSRPEKFLKDIALNGSLGHDIIILLIFLIVLQCMVYSILFFKVKKARQL